MRFFPIFFLIYIIRLQMWVFLLLLLLLVFVCDKWKVFFRDERNFPSSAFYNLSIVCMAKKKEKRCQNCCLSSYLNILLESQYEQLVSFSSHLSTSIVSVMLCACDKLYMYNSTIAVSGNWKIENLIFSRVILLCCSIPSQWKNSSDRWEGILIW